MKPARRGEAVAVIVIVLILAAILFPVFAQPKGGPKRRPCTTSVKLQALGLILYADDNDGRFVPRDAWMDATDPYVKNDVLRHCPSVTKGTFGYAFNGALDRTPSLSLRRPESVAMVYDSVNPIRNASDLVKSLPFPGRHSRRDNVGYADGRMKGILVQ